jgi:hypothetical protein
MLNGASIPPAQHGVPGWSVDGRGFVVVDTPDTFGAMTLEIAR